MAAIAMGKKWRTNLISSADREYEESLKRRKKITRDLVDAVSDLRGSAKAAHDAALAYMSEKGIGKKDLIALLSCTPIEAKLIFDDEAIAQIDDEETSEVAESASTEEVADSGADNSPENSETEPEVQSDENPAVTNSSSPITGYSYSNY